MDNGSIAPIIEKPNPVQCQIAYLRVFKCDYIVLYYICLVLFLSPSRTEIEIIVFEETYHI